MASGVFPDLDVRISERARRRRVRGRGAGSLITSVEPREDLVEDPADLPGVITVDASTGEVLIDLRTIEERARSIDLVSVDSPLRDTAPPTVTVVPRAARDGVKRAFDVSAVVVSAPLWAPLVLALAGLIRASSKGAAFYGHERVGRGGRTIKCLKLRTMVEDADRRLAELLASDPELAAEFAHTFKLKDDPRVTRVGRFLRKTSLDELPQLINVLKGEMSLVGPRPITEGEIRRYGQYMPIVLSARPGMTGLWQVSGRNDVSYATRVALDVQYAFGQSLISDLAIIARTFVRVFRPSQGGAY
jgi:lipopolysaccharide/colanic/teichoic acid biosynthesis glycosyltransferase